MPEDAQSASFHLRAVGTVLGLNVATVFDMCTLSFGLGFILFEYLIY